MQAGSAIGKDRWSTKLVRCWRGCGSCLGGGRWWWRASGFWPACERAVRREVERVVMVHPQRVKAIAAARLKNDRVDSETLAHLSRADLLLEARMADERTQQIRKLTRLRIGLGRQRAAAKNQLQAVLHQEGFLKPVTDVFGKRGRAWLQGLALSAAGRMVADTWLKVVDHLDGLIAEQTRELERLAETDARARWLQTGPGIRAYSAMVILAEVGEIARSRPGTRPPPGPGSPGCARRSRYSRPGSPWRASCWPPS